MSKLSIEERVNLIEDRNKKVALDKAWETSWQRRMLILVLTYFVVLIYFLMINIKNPYLSAVVPTLGFYLSTLTLSIAKKLWVERLTK